MNNREWAYVIFSAGSLLWIFSKVKLKHTTWSKAIKETNLVGSILFTLSYALLFFVVLLHLQVVSASYIPLLIMGVWISPLILMQTQQAPMTRFSWYGFAIPYIQLTFYMTYLRLSNYSIWVEFILTILFGVLLIISKTELKRSSFIAIVLLLFADFAYEWNTYTANSSISYYALLLPVLPSLLFIVPVYGWVLYQKARCLKELTNMYRPEYPELEAPAIAATMKQYWMNLPKLSAHVWFFLARYGVIVGQKSDFQYSQQREIQIKVQAFRNFRNSTPGYTSEYPDGTCDGTVLIQIAPVEDLNLDPEQAQKNAIVHLQENPTVYSKLLLEEATQHKATDKNEKFHFRKDIGVGKIVVLEEEQDDYAILELEYECAWNNSVRTLRICKGMLV